MIQSDGFKILLSLLLIQSAFARTITHRKMTVDADGNREITTWTTTDNSDAENIEPLHAQSSNAFHTFFTTGNVPDSLQPTSEFVQVGGIGLSMEDLLKRTALTKGMDPTAIDELLKTKQPVVRTSAGGNGLTRTTTYSLKPDGSISSRTVTQMNPIVINRTGEPSGESPPQWSMLPSMGNGATGNGDTKPDWEWATPLAGSSPSVSTPRVQPSWPETDTVFERRHKPKEHPLFEPPAGAKPWENVPVTTPSQQPSLPDSGTTVPTNIITTTPLPSLEDFLKSQYGTSAAPSAQGKPVTTIKLDDLPVTTVIKADEAANQDVFTHIPKGLGGLEPLPTITTTTPAPPPNILPPTSNYHPIVESNIHSFTKTIQGNSPPTAADLEPRLREILEKAGINPNEVRGGQGNTITKTRIEPDGSKVTTTFRVRPINAPNGINAESMPGPFDSFFGGHTPAALTPKAPTATRFNEFDTNAVELVPKVATASSPIDAYLAKVGLTPEDLERKNGELVKTIVEDNGRVLTATFILSSVKGEEGSSKKQEKPDK